MDSFTVEYVNMYGRRPDLAQHAARRAGVERPALSIHGASIYNT